MNNEIFIMLYKFRIRPFLEYGNAMWNAQYKKIRRRAISTKMIPMINKLSYEDHLKVLKLFSLY